MIYKLLDPKHPFGHTEMPPYVDSDEVSRKQISDPCRNHETLWWNWTLCKSSWTPI